MNSLRRLRRSVVHLGIALSLLAWPVGEALGQVLGSQIKPADQLLDTYLARVEQLSEQYCTKVEMSRVEVGVDTHSHINTYVLAAHSKARKFSYLAYGEEYSVEEADRMLWEEKLRFEDKHLYKVTGSTRPSKASNRLRQSDGEVLTRRMQSPEVFNPLALPIYAGSLILQRKVDIDFVKPIFLNSVDFERSSIDSKSGNVTGDWIFHSGYSVAQIEFGANVGYMPIESRFYRFNQSTERADPTPFAVTKTQWQRVPGGNWLPSKCELVSTDSDKTRREFVLDVAWAPSKALDKSSFEIEPMLTTERETDWQTRIFGMFQ